MESLLTVLGLLAFNALAVVILYRLHMRQNNISGHSSHH